MKNVQEEEMIVFLSGIKDISLNLELDNAGGVLSRNDKLFKKGVNENPENTVDDSCWQGAVVPHTRHLCLCH